MSTGVAAPKKSNKADRVYDEKTWKRLRTNAVTSARSNRYHHADEDLAQDVMEKFLKSPDTSQTVNQAVIDAMRKRIGDNRSPTFSERWRLDFGDLQLEDYHLMKDEPNGAAIDAAFALKSLKGIDRAVVFLYFIWGLTLLEIGICFGISEARASQRMTAALKFLKGKMR